MSCIEVFLFFINKYSDTISAAKLKIETDIYIKIAGKGCIKREFSIDT